LAAEKESFSERPGPVKDYLGPRLTMITGKKTLSDFTSLPVDHPEFDAIAKWYDFDYERRVREDLAFYFRIACEGGNPILELGAGTGRVTAALALGGFDVTAVDISPEMLERAKQRFGRLRHSRGRVRFVRADMAELALRGRFRTILVPFRSFHHLYTIDRQLSTLRAIRRLLAKDGIAVFDLLQPDLTYFGAIEGKTKISYERRRRETGTKVIQRFRLLCDFPHQMGYIEYIWDEYKGRKKLSTDRALMRWRWFHLFEFEHLLARAGLRVLRVVGGFDGRPYAADAREMIFVAARDGARSAKRSKRGAPDRSSSG
jgi:ubiquinone/menaquinone biosynthesis C-methylase UbiE